MLDDALLGGRRAIQKKLHITRRQPIRPPVATLVEFLTLSRLTHGPLRRNGRLEVVPLAGGRVMQADITELARPGRDEPQLGGLGSFAGFAGKVYRHFRFCKWPDPLAALYLTQSSSMFTFFFKSI